jgi:hypothetical protein
MPRRRGEYPIGRDDVFSGRIYAVLTKLDAKSETEERVRSMSFARTPR